MTDEFLKAFNHAMLYEVGKHWNPNDPDVIAGKIETTSQKRKVGYVNHPADPGGETKYGVAQRANKDISVRDLDLAGAHKRFEEKYWYAGKCDKLPYPLSMLHFDGCVNHGIGQAAKFLQRAVGAVADGIIGPKTLAAVEAANQEDIIDSIVKQRRQFYEAIVQRNPSQVVFLKGWKLRIDEVYTYVLSEMRERTNAQST